MTKQMIGVLRVKYLHSHFDDQNLIHVLRFCHIFIQNHYSPALKKWGYTGFSLSFCHSFCPSFLPSVHFSDKFRRTFLNYCKGYKVETCYTHTQWVDVSCIPESGARAPNSWSSFNRFYNLPLISVHLSDKFSSHFSQLL